MRGHDEDLERIRTGGSCAAVLEGLQPGWALDKRENTRHCLKYRAGSGRTLIVNHEGRGSSASAWCVSGLARAPGSHTATEQDA